MKKNLFFVSIFMLFLITACTGTTDDIFDNTINDGMTTRAGTNGLSISGESVADMGYYYTFTLNGNTANLPVDWYFLRIDDSGKYVNCAESIIVRSIDNTKFIISILAKSGNYIVRAVTGGNGPRVDFPVNVKAYADKTGTNLEIKTYKAFRQNNGHITYYENTDEVEGATKLSDKYGFRTFNIKPYATHPYYSAIREVLCYIYTTPNIYTIYDTQDKQYLGWWYGFGTFYISFNGRTGMVPLYSVAEEIYYGAGYYEYRNRHFSTDPITDSKYRNFGLVGYAYPL